MKYEEAKKEFMQLIESVAYRYQSWKIFRDFCKISAIALYQPFARDEKLEEEYMSVISDYEKKDIEIIIITKKPASNLDPDYFARIPATAVYRTDTNFGILKSLGKQLETDLSTNLPVVTIIKPNGDVVFLKAGYSIGIGEELLKTL